MTFLSVPLVQHQSAFSSSMYLPLCIFDMLKPCYSSMENMSALEQALDILPITVNVMTRQVKEAVIV